MYFAIFSLFPLVECIDSVLVVYRAVLIIQNTKKGFENKSGPPACRLHK
jgi:hypothetical protein